jgi:hypothetical protein
MWCTRSATVKNTKKWKLFLSFKTHRSLVCLWGCDCFFAAKSRRLFRGRTSRTSIGVSSFSCYVCLSSVGTNFSWICAWHSNDLTILASALTKGNLERSGLVESRLRSVVYAVSNICDLAVRLANTFSAIYTMACLSFTFLSSWNRPITYSLKNSCLPLVQPLEERLTLPLHCDQSAWVVSLSGGSDWGSHLLYHHTVRDTCAKPSLQVCYVADWIGYYLSWQAYSRLSDSPRHVTPTVPQILQGDSKANKWKLENYTAWTRLLHTLVTG